MSLINRIKKAWDVLTGSDQPEVEQSNKPSLDEATFLNNKMDDLIRNAIMGHIKDGKAFKAEVNHRVHTRLYDYYKDSNVRYDGKWTGKITYDGRRTSSGLKFVHSTLLKESYDRLVYAELLAHELLAEWQAQQQDKGCVNV